MQLLSFELVALVLALALALVLFVVTLAVYRYLHEHVRATSQVATVVGLVLLVGTYDGKGEASQPLLSALPDVVLLSREEAGSPLLHVLAEEMQVEAPGQRALLDRLLDVLLISTLRTWFAARQDDAPGWFRAQHDPAVGQALSLLHQNVAHPWTVDELAADLLVSSDATVASVARQVGYGTPFSLSAAFKRVHGRKPAAVPPGQGQRVATSRDQAGRSSRHTR